MLAFALFVPMFSRIAVFRFILDLAVFRGKRLFAGSWERGESLAFYVLNVGSSVSSVILLMAFMDF